ncbi:hypothetical protein BCR44DRAFT_67178 [Catenaria anguillulae PL171]|uniref:LysM domain-containing protein n=1 Tax=Catenaria anguillulae PL171 TaxID=765915 RepID=A0A1Y2I882_9FUNG|nr:hypothetical protein BCR44DRAFT_67178 [Catenaria anguillulae PL171]
MLSSASLLRTLSLFALATLLAVQAEPSAEQSRSRHVVNTATDTCDRIAAFSSISVSELVSWNNGLDCSSLTSGELLFVSPPSESTVHRHRALARRAPLRRCVFRAQVRADIGRAGNDLKCSQSDVVFTAAGDRLTAQQALAKKVKVECDHSLEVQEVIQGFIKPMRDALVAADPNNLSNVCVPFQAGTYMDEIDNLLNGPSNLNFADKDVNTEKRLMVSDSASARSAKSHPALYTALDKHMANVKSKRVKTASSIVDVINKFYRDHPTAPKPANYGATVASFNARAADNFSTWRTSHPAPGARAPRPRPPPKRKNSGGDTSDSDFVPSPPSSPPKPQRPPRKKQTVGKGKKN